ncbi:acyl-CoA dehydrogenase family protein [Agromyces agglutinans]|uniref:acyl-CoA dehydrogenase family protein n=1 Tax=Agromyces agglutinans TaxID=2662258 RepID=UPI0028AC0C80|nr:acyl-CoA dehydrogenase family protein [Agromyces agglutinans]
MPTFDEAAFRAAVDAFAPGAAERERDRTLLFAEVSRLQELGFGAQRLPAELGGPDEAFEAVIARLIDLAAADSNLAHVQRGHLAFVEALRLDSVPEADLREQAPRLRTWAGRILAGEFVGNAQSERQLLGELGTRLQRDDHGLRLTGRKYYTTGSIYADWIHLSALEGDERVAVTVSARQPGVRTIDDWDGFGQPLTGSGTTVFDGAVVDAAEVSSAGDPSRWTLIGAVFQLVLLAVVAGIARRALDDTVEYVRPRERTFGYPGARPPRNDPLVQAQLGRLSAASAAARAVVLDAGRTLGAVLERTRAGTAGPTEARDAQLQVFRAQHTVPALVLDVLTELFEVGGASAVGTGRALDRHWRNVRTIASHNPTAQRLAALGQFELDGTLPDWQAPGAPQAAEVREAALR